MKVISPASLFRPLSMQLELCYFFQSTYPFTFLSSPFFWDL
uniref:Uncharacterized protein n=1 Tax=Manihot esculenta TaxID=3983 RepID=A0A2C9VXM4_MANES